MSNRQSHSIIYTFIDREYMIANIRNSVNNKCMLDRVPCVCYYSGVINNTNAMPINIIEMTSKKVKGEYVSKKDTFPVFISGKFVDEQTAKIALAKQLLIEGKISAGSYMGILSGIKVKRPKSYYSTIGKKGMDIRWNK